VRLFFALWPDDDARRISHKAALALRVAVDAPAVRPENYHTTLAFARSLEPQLAVLQQIGALSGPQPVRFGRRVRLLAGSASGVPLRGNRRLR